MSTPEPTITGERSTLERSAYHIRARLENRLHELSKRVEDTKEALDLARVIREKPLAAAGAALAAGALIGFAFGGKRGPVSGMLGTLITGTLVQVARTFISSRIEGVISPTDTRRA